MYNSHKMLTIKYPFNSHKMLTTEYPFNSHKMLTTEYQFNSHKMLTYNLDNYIMKQKTLIEPISFHANSLSSWMNSLSGVGLVFSI